MMDLLFIHAPKFNDTAEGMGEAMFVNLIPSGVFAMADFLEREGVETRILHLGIEWILRGRFDPVPFMEADRPGAVALSLHWHHQSYDVVETARRIKERFPEMPIILGGLTAGYFAREIIERYPFIDFVVDGDGEIPLLELMRLIKGGILRGSGDECVEALNNIHNLYYNLKNFKESIVDDTFLDWERERKNRDRNVRSAENQEGQGWKPLLQGVGTGMPILRGVEAGSLSYRESGLENPSYRGKAFVVRSEGRYVSSAEMLDSLNYTNFSLLEDFEFYRDQMGIPALWLKNGNVEYNRRHLHRMTKVFFPSTGRGCPAKCSWCGRERRLPPVFRDSRKVLDSIREAEKAGFESLYFTYDPCGQASRYYIELFRLIREAAVDMFAYFECWGLPEGELIREFKKTFHDGVFALSPESGSEEMRKRNRGIYYSNAHLEATLELMEKEGVEADLFFSLGIPGENEEIFNETVKMMKGFRKRFANLGEVCLFGIELEPGSPWFEDPEKFGIVSGRRSFEDYYNAHKPGNRGSYSSLGYYIPGYFSDKTKCSGVREFEDAIEKLRKENLRLEDIFREKDL